MFLMDSDKENGRHRVYNFAVNAVGRRYMLEKLDVVFDSLKCTAKLNVAFGFVLKMVEDGSFRWYYVHENITLIKRSKLVATTEMLTKITNLVSNTDDIESCTREQVKTKWKFYKLTKFTIFTAFVKEVPMGCKDTVLPDPKIKSRSINSLTFEENTRKPYNDTFLLLRALPFQLHGNERL